MAMVTTTLPEIKEAEAITKIETAVVDHSAIMEEEAADLTEATGTIADMATIEEMAEAEVEVALAGDIR